MLDWDLGAPAEPIEGAQPPLAAAWPAGLAADFYARPEDVVRGVSIPESFCVDSHIAQRGFKACRHDDEAAAKCSDSRELTSSSGDDRTPQPDVLHEAARPTCPGLDTDTNGRCRSGGNQTAFDVPSHIAKISEEAPYNADIDVNGPRLSDSNLSVPGRFFDGDEPPRAPQDPYFCFSRTTVHFSETSPVEVGNRLLGFVDGRSDLLSITKFTRDKFAIKLHCVAPPSEFLGDPDREGLSCEMKVRMYGCDDSCALELRRRAGDVTVFAELYRIILKGIGSLA